VKAEGKASSHKDLRGRRYHQPENHLVLEMQDEITPRH
jgi:hypothetical protein